MEQATRTPLHLWIIGVLSALWNAVGAFDYAMTQTRNAGYLAQLTAEQRDYLESFSPVMTSAWALGVWGGLAGSLLLLARNRHSVTAFGLSLAGLFVASIYQFLINPGPPSMRSAGALAFTAAIWIGAIALLYYAFRMRGKGVLR